MPELEDVALRRDYKMRAKIRQRCIKCNGFLWLHRSKGIKLRCKNSQCLTVHLIPRVCTYCGYIDIMDAQDCKICEPIIREITELEVNIEIVEKGLKKLSRNLKMRKISNEVFKMMFEEYEDEILLCQKKLIDLRTKRTEVKVTEKPLEIQTR